MEEGQILDHPQRPIVACLRCREQKLKCGRELPSCERCRKQSAVCTYPAPPDRKQIAQKTRRAKTSQSNHGNPPHQSESSPEATTKAAAKRRRVSPDPSSPFHCLAHPETAELPSTEVGLLLHEVFYKRVYSANLLFHKTVSFQVYMLKKTPEYLQRAISALAAIFLQEVHSPHQRHVKVLPMQKLYDQSWSWAHAASVEVLSHVDEPSVLKIQTLQVLHLYYLSRGEIIRAKVHASLAYQLSRLLAYDDLQEPNESYPNRSLQFDREIRRRSFWASWCSMCFGSEDFSASQLCESAVGLPLPARFSEGGSIQGVDLIIGPQLSRDWRLCMDDEQPKSLMAEMIRFLGIWTTVRTWVCHSHSMPNPQRAGELVRLDKLLEDAELSMNLPVIDLLAAAKSCDESPELLASVCSLYHLSRLIIPAFEVTVIENRPLLLSDVADTSIGMCSKIVFDQALNFTALLQQLIEGNLDITRLWPFSGYAVFLVANIFLNMYNAMLQSGVPAGAPIRIPGPDSNILKTLQTILGVLSIYWKPLQTLDSKLKETILATRHAETGRCAAPPFPWEYIAFFSTGEPTSHIGQHRLEVQEDTQKDMIAEEEMPQEYTDDTLMPRMLYHQKTPSYTGP